MPLHNVTIDDASALIAYYNPNDIPWKDSPSNDTGLAQYWDSTYHSSNQTGAWSTFRFEGTAVYLFAATRWMHGSYDILMDNQLAYQGNGHTSTSIFNQLVFNVTNLTPGWHNLTLLNTDPGLYIEVDYIIWTTVMSAELTERSGTPIPYTLGNMTYDGSVWNDNNPGSSPYMVTGTSGATVNITFQGNGIELYGRTGPQYGVFSAQVDGYEHHELNAYSGGVHNTLLFRQDNFTDGQHTLVVTNRGNASLAISSAIPIIWSNAQNPPAASDKIRTGLIVGLALGLAIGLTMLVLLWVWFARRHRAHHGVYIDDHSKVPTVYGREYEATPFIFPHVHLGEQTSTHTPTKYTGQMAQGTRYPVSYHALPTSPGTGSSTIFEYHLSPTSLASPGFDYQPGSSRPYAYNVSPVHVVAASSRSQAQTPELTVSLRDSDAGPIVFPPAYSAGVVSRERD
ncbi:hypothetical protein ACGC1H_003147 [Rhizoctonia solani]